MEVAPERFLGLDYGTKTVGVAVSDALGITAQGVETIKRERPTKLRQTLSRIESIINEYNIKGVVLGYPKHMNNDEGERCKATVEFADMLIRRTNLPVYLYDERLTTMQSNRALDEIGYKDKKDIIDEMAAMLILQAFLEQKANGNNPEKIRYYGKN